MWDSDSFMFVNLMIFVILVMSICLIYHTTKVQQP
jgi:hypothetical protein